MYIAISGNIGSGKTTLTQLLAQHYNWQARFEAVDYNPYLEDYYGNIPRWSFNLEVYFLKERFKDLLAIAQSPTPIVQDRSIFVDLFEQMMSVAKLPDLMIYLRADIPYLIRNIQQRGRDYERQMPLDYLARLNDKYEDFIQNKYPGPVLILDKAQYDFTNPIDMLKIYDKIDAALGNSATLGLEEGQ